MLRLLFLAALIACVCNAQAVEHILERHAEGKDIGKLAQHMTHQQALELIELSRSGSQLAGASSQLVNDLRDYIETHPLVSLLSDKRRSLNYDHLEHQQLAVNQTFFTQKLDHFQLADDRTWQQHITIIDEWWQPGNPIFLFLDGEALASAFDFQEWLPVELAKIYGAKYISIAHRYYGPDDLPFTGYTTENLAWLSADQALADAAAFINGYNQNELQGLQPSKWIVWGCSYSGALSAWFRLKYPQLAIASIAPSGPVQANANFTEYFGQFEITCNLVGLGDCVTAVEQGVSQIMSLEAQGSSGLTQLQQIFNSCAPIGTTDTPIWFFNNALTETVGSADQFDNPPDWPLNQTCNIMTSSTNYAQNWAQAYGLPQGHCNSFNMTEFLRLLSLPIPSASRSWWWQKCTEFGFFKPSYPGTSVFFSDVSVEDIQGLCEGIFGIPNMAPNTEWTNTEYGGYNLAATEVMFTNGFYDPWHTLSIFEDQPGVQASAYNGGHCQPMDQTSANDEPTVVATRQAVSDFIAQALLNS